MKFNGLGVSGGIATGSIFYLTTPDLTVTRIDNCDVVSQRKRFLKAVNKAKGQLRQLYDRTLETDSESAEIFHVHMMMLDDPNFTEGVEQLLNQGLNAEYAARTAGDNLKNMLEDLDDDYLKARAADVCDITDRVIAILKGIDQTPLQPKGKVVVVAEELYPSQTMKLNKDFVVGFVTRHGSQTSHSVILARSMGIPCIVNVQRFNDIPHSGTIAMDGTTGEILVNPSEQQLATIGNKLLRQQQQRKQLLDYCGKAVSKCGKSMDVCANIGNPSDVRQVLENHADGVGLFRSEFIYLDRQTFPSEQEQFAAYKEVLEKMSPLPVVIRTLDIGSDKQAPYFNIGKEDNPAMGYRAIRICLDKEEIFVTQLRALLRASLYGNLNIMFPMISDIEQVYRIKRIVQRVKDQLTSENISFADDIPLGVMIETPASVIISDLLAKEVDFFSIGTNDLTQYTLAADRTNEKTAHLFDSRNIAVLRMIELTVKNAHANGIKVGICGESAADTTLTQFYIDVGIDKLSVSPAAVLKVKKAVCQCN